MRTSDNQKYELIWACVWVVVYYSQFSSIRSTVYTPFSIWCAKYFIHRAALSTAFIQMCKMTNVYRFNSRFAHFVPPNSHQIGSNAIHSIMTS